MNEIYTHGHHESVLRSHRARTVENSAKYLERSLSSGQRLLDVGCGPGSVTVDLAGRVAPGPVIGLDRVASVLTEARALAVDAGLSNVTFSIGDANALQFDDASFDVVHAHQLLQHLVDPIGALREMRRVLRPGGVLAVRDADYGGFVWAPSDPLLDRWLELYHAVTTHNRAQADAGRHLLGWAHAAGFKDAQVGSSTWTFADRPARQWWGGLWAERVQASSFADQAIAYGLSNRVELAGIATAWRRWIAAPDGFFSVLHGEVLAGR